MIDLNAEHLKQTGENPYARDPSDVQANPSNWGNPYDSMLGHLSNIEVDIKRIADVGEDARIGPREMQVFLSSVAWQNTLSLRTKTLVISVTAACIVSLVVGSGVQMSFSFASADTKVIPYITAIGAGVDLSITSTAGTATAYFIAFPMG